MVSAARRFTRVVRERPSGVSVSARSVFLLLLTAALGWGCVGELTESGTPTVSNDRPDGRGDGGLPTPLDTVPPGTDGGSNPAPEPGPTPGPGPAPSSNSDAGATDGGADPGPNPAPDPGPGPNPMPTPMPMPGAELRAFPGAEGFGSLTAGGRGGDVYIVTNTNNDGPGSLREAVSASGPRIVVFETGGTISLESGLRIGNPNITIAGQTAPGGGIAIRNGDHTGTSLRIATSDVVIRGLRIRPGPGGEPDGIYMDGRAHDIIIDHTSVSWAVDENITAATGAHDISIQWSIISQGLLNATHHKGNHSMGLMFGSGSNDDDTHNISTHHNLLAHNFRRNPLCQINGTIDFVNNTIYNWGDDSWSGFAGYFDNGAHINYIGNFILHGPSSNDAYAMRIHTGDGDIWAYVAGNISSLHRMSLSDPEHNVVSDRSRDRLVDTPFDVVPVGIDDATAAHMDVLAQAGAILPQRDSVDTTVVRSVTEGTAHIIDDPSEMGGWPELSAGTAPADSDSDGMPDAFESANGLNPNDASDANGTGLSETFTGVAGYTNIEVYINGLYTMQ